MAGVPLNGLARRANRIGVDAACAQFPLGLGPVISPAVFQRGLGFRYAALLAAGLVRRSPQRAGVATDERGTVMSDNDRRGGSDGPNTGVVVKARPKTRKPPMYKVLMLNDDYTPMEFVVHVLERFFQKSREEATRIMLHVHRRGVGVCGVFTYEVAETKVTQVMDLARQNQHPLQCTIEKE
jgi:ATP-dependent Clp protease adaptor protein ClpS